MPATNALPPLQQAIREVLEASIARFGVVVPVVKDQRGDTVDGFVREEIAAKLGVECPSVMKECTAEERFQLREELNLLRRQLAPAQWKPMVDHLRAAGYADKLIATAVAVPLHDVRHHSTEGQALPEARLGRDGRVLAAPGEESANVRALFWVREAGDLGLTSGELRGVVTAGEERPYNASATLRKLEKAGSVRVIGTRDGKSRGKVYVAVPEAPALARRYKAGDPWGSLVTTLTRTTSTLKHWTNDYDDMPLPPQETLDAVSEKLAMLLLWGGKLEPRLANPPKPKAAGK